MGALSRNLVLVLLAWLMLAGVCLGKQVYLKDGSIIDCESFWRRGNQVIVKVNRDVVLDFERNEVDLKRTFPETRKKPKPIKRKKIAHAAVPPSAVNQAAESAAPPAAPVAAAAQTPVAAPAPAMKQAQPVAVTVPAPNPVPATATVPAPASPVQPETTQPAPADPASPTDKAEQERKMKEAAEMMAEAIKKQDPELLKKAVEAQKNAVPPEQRAQSRGLSIKILLFLLVFTLLIVISMWVVYVKTGQPGWHSIIPIYNMYVLMEISGKPWWWMFLLFIPVVGFIIYLLAMLSLAQRFGRGVVYGLGLFFLPMFFFPMLAFGGAQYEG
ncbi:DUF5684 domain-containing protein [Geotalea toluenoxydans]|uniref:DUF5684 domain-containing protein n=1 Tax=Geotalea toluenoxydans TaxID=421624 RepID=UPI0006D13DBF|nr:DUF5684 domain-containing protein [Geotalea toluenoxydans]